MLELIMTLGPATITSLKVDDAIVAGAIDWLQSLKQRVLKPVLKQSHPSKTGYKYMI